MITERDQIQWQPISMLSTVACFIDRNIDNATEHVANLRYFHQRPYGTLDEHTVTRFIRLITTDFEYLDIFTEQLRRWKTECLAQPLRQEITRLEQQLPRLRALLTEAMSLARDMEERTIEKVMAKSHLQLGLEALLRTRKG